MHVNKSRKNKNERNDQQKNVNNIVIKKKANPG